MKRLLIVVMMLCASNLLWAEDEPKSTWLTPQGQAELLRHYVAIGDSVSQGCQGLNVEEGRQYYSWPAQLARQIGVEFNQPLMKYPGCGIPNPEDWINDPKIGLDDLMKGFLFPRRVDGYDNQERIDNYAISGATLGQVLDWHYTAIGPDRSAFVEMVGITSPWVTATLGGHLKKQYASAVDQALAREPSLLTVWIGNNDSFISMVAGTSKYCTPVATFNEQWDELVRRIKATPSIKGVVVANLPNPTVVPLLQPVNNPYNEVLCEVPEGAKVPFFVRKTKSVNDVVTREEIERIGSFVEAYNAKIEQSVRENGWVLVDGNALFDQIVKDGMRLSYADGTPSDIVLDAGYGTGGIFTLDGMHPSSPAYAFTANMVIRAINDHWGTAIPLIDEVEVWQNDSFCQNPIDPRQGDSKYLGWLTFGYNMLGSPMSRDKYVGEAAAAEL